MGFVGTLDIHYGEIRQRGHAYKYNNMNMNNIVTNIDSLLEMPKGSDFWKEVGYSLSQEL